MDKRELVRRHYADILLRLCESHKLRDLTVADVVEAAGTARQTFYNYFSDLNDLICFTAFLPMADASDPFTDPHSTRKTHEVTLARKAFYSQLPQHMGQNNFWEALSAWLRQTYYERYLTEGLADEEREYRKVCIDLYCLGDVAVFKEWCANGMDVSLDALTAMLYDMSPAFVKEDLDRLPGRASSSPR